VCVCVSDMISLSALATSRLHQQAKTQSTSDVSPYKPTLRQLEAYFAWIKACGGWENKPDFPAWDGLSSTAKMRFHKTVDRSENDRFSGGQYDGPYSGFDIDVILRTQNNSKKWSIEHVLPRSKVNGRNTGKAENDWFGWDVATRGRNSQRGNLPLVLWPTPSLSIGVVNFDGEKHYNPLEEHKARLARRWIYSRATYGLDDSLAPPSDAQRKHAREIGALCSSASLSYAEKRLHSFLTTRVEQELGKDWKNPLNTSPEHRKLFLDNEEFLGFVFQLRNFQ
jgi:hypothetical protein